MAGAAQILVNEGTAYAQLVIYGDDATTTEDEGMSGSSLRCRFTIQARTITTTTIQPRAKRNSTGG